MGIDASTSLYIQALAILPIRLRAAAVAINAVPRACDPVKAMALISGCAARAWPTVRPGPNSSEYTPPGSPLSRWARATSSSRRASR